MTDTLPAPRLGSGYWRLLTASGISNLGDGIFLAALPLLAAQITRSEVQISITAAAALLPWLLFALPVGAIIDRSDRRRIMVRTDLVRAVLVAAITVALVLDVQQIWMLWLLAFSLGTAEVFFDSASQAMLPAVVDEHLLHKANGWKWSLELVTNTFLGTPLGALLFTLAVALPFGINAASFVVAAALVAGIRGSFDVSPAGPRPTTSMAAELRTGMQWLWRQRVLRSIALSLAITNLAFQMPLAVFVLFAQDELGVGERSYGLLLALMGFGGVVGGLLGDRIVARLGQTTCIYLAIFIWIGAMLAIAAYPTAWLVALMVTIEAMATTVWNVVTVSLRQQMIPPQLFGRVNGVYRWLAWGTLPLGAIAGGQVANALGLRATYVVAAALMVLALAVLVRDVRTSTIVQALAESRRAQGLDDTPVAKDDRWPE